MSFRWPLTFSSEGLPEGVAGDARGPVIRIRKGYEADEGLYQHELRHVKQWALVGLVLGTLNALAAWLISTAWSATLAPIGGLTPTQAAATMGFAAFVAGHGALYLFTRAYRLAAEADAYRAQMRFPDGRGGQLTLDKAAELLKRPNYRLGLTFAQARNALREES